MSVAKESLVSLVPNHCCSNTPFGILEAVTVFYWNIIKEVIIYDITDVKDKKKNNEIVSITKRVVTTFLINLKEVITWNVTNERKNILIVSKEYNSGMDSLNSDGLNLSAIKKK